MPSARTYHSPQALFQRILKTRLGDFSKMSAPAGNVLDFRSQLVTNPIPPVALADTSCQSYEELLEKEPLAIIRRNVTVESKAVQSTTESVECAFLETSLACNRNMEKILEEAVEEIQHIEAVEDYKQKRKSLLDLEVKRFRHLAELEETNERHALQQRLQIQQQYSNYLQQQVLFKKLGSVARLDQAVQGMFEKAWSQVLGRGCIEFVSPNEKLLLDSEFLQYFDSALRKVAQRSFDLQTVQDHLMRTTFKRRH